MKKLMGEILPTFGKTGEGTELSTMGRVPAQLKPINLIHKKILPLKRDPGTIGLVSH